MVKNKAGEGMAEVQEWMDSKLLEVKESLREEAENQLEELKNQLPTKEFLIAEFKGKSCSPEAQIIIEKIYNKLINPLNKAQSTTEKINLKITKNKEKLDKIFEKSDGVGSKIKIANDGISILSGIIKAGKMALNAFPPSTAAPPGGIIIKASNKVNDAEEKTEKVKDTTKAVAEGIKNIIKKASRLLIIVNMIMKAIQTILSFIKKLITILEVLYLNYLKHCNIGNQDPTDSGGNINTDLLDYDLSSLIEEGDGILEELELSGNKEIIEKIFDANFQMIGYRRYKV